MSDAHQLRGQEFQRQDWPATLFGIRSVKTLVRLSFSFSVAASDGASLQCLHKPGLQLSFPNGGRGTTSRRTKVFPGQVDVAKIASTTDSEGGKRTLKETWESHRQPTTLGRGSFCQFSSVTSKGTSTLLLLSLSSKLACFSSAHDLSALDACTFCELISGCLQSQHHLALRDQLHSPFVHFA